MMTSCINCSEVSLSSADAVSNRRVREVVGIRGTVVAQL